MPNPQGCNERSVSGVNRAALPGPLTPDGAVSVGGQRRLPQQAQDQYGDSDDEKGKRYKLPRVDVLCGSLNAQRLTAWCAA
jgi:hypothetical protein